ncbi:HAD family hydrolase [Streptococcus cristatus]|uniref:HAD family hydrolase n=1 Tax=Streptococcus cristatus TaxID=45634 RepID=UPI000F676B7B|nr:HAD family hydrolase [Streptococcus cristatus]RSJ72689.1 Pyrimidine 5'-nucleotidase YjjG [Streptococcus cristatus]
MTNYKWLFFDIGSTLINEEKAYQDRIEQAIAETNITYDTFYQRMLVLFQEGLKGDLIALQKYSLERPKWKSELEILYPDAKIVLETLHNRYKIGVIANQLPNLEKRLENFGIRQWIDLIISSADCGFSKPSSKIFQLALQQASCSASSATMIGDRLDNDIAPAKALGMKTIWIKQGFSAYSPIQSPSEEPDFTVNSLSDLLKIL